MSDFLGMSQIPLHAYCSVFYCSPYLLKSQRFSGWQRTVCIYLFNNCLIFFNPFLNRSHCLNRMLSSLLVSSFVSIMSVKIRFFLSFLILDHFMHDRCTYIFLQRNLRIPHCWIGNLCARNYHGALSFYWVVVLLLLMQVR